MYNAKVNRLKGNEELVRYTLIAVFRHLAAVIAGFFASSASFEGISPFGVSLCACISPEYIPAAVLGAASGYFYVYDVTVLTLRYIAAAAVAGIISYILKRNLKKKYTRHGSVVCAFVPVLVTGLILSLSVTVSADEFILYLLEATVSGAAAWFISGFLSINTAKRSAARLTVSETSCVLVVFGLVILSLGSFRFFMISPCVIAGVYAVLAAATFGGDRFAALFGIAASAVIEIVMPETFLTGSIALGGLLAGIFGRKNRFFTSLIFAVTVSASAFTSDDWVSAAYVIFGVGIAIALFVLTPKKLADVYTGIFSFSGDTAFLTGQKNILKTRLRTAAEGMSDVTASVKAIAGIYRRRSAPKEENIYANVCSSVCKKCRNYELCWNRNYSRTYDYFVKLAKVLKYGESHDDKDFPQGFLVNCIAPEKVMKSVSYELERYRSAMREAAKTGETVNIVSDQFSSVSELLCSFADNMEHSEEFDNEKTGMVYDVLVNDFGAKVQGVGVFRNEYNKLYCEINVAEDKRFSEKSVVKTVEQVLGVTFEKPVVHSISDGSICITVCETTRYTVATGGYQISSDGGKWCGDSFDSFFDGRGNFYMILSDGMGTGKKAAADSVMCSSLASILLRSGYSAECIIKMINSAMLVRSGEESLATLDIAVMNLYTGDVRFYKAGAAPSVAMRHMKLLKISKPSLPVGILGNVKFETVELTLREGDSFVLMSDGVNENVFSAWRALLNDSSAYSGKELADRLAKSAHMNADKNSPDDITVVTASVRKNDKQ